MEGSGIDGLIGSSVVLSEEQKEVLVDLERSIDKHGASLGGEFFIKFSTRSPKDAVFENPNEVVQEYLVCLPAFSS